MVKQRMRDQGLDKKTLAKLNKISKKHLLGMPEATIVTIVEIVVENLKHGKGTVETLLESEDFRIKRGLATDKERFSRILEGAKIPKNVPQAVSDYCWYRVELDHTKSMTYAILEAFHKAVDIYWDVN